MKVKASSKTTSVMVECFFYAVVIIQTGVAAFAYQPLLRAAQLWPIGIACFALSYFSIFALAFVELQRIHRARKKARAAAPAVRLLNPVSAAQPVFPQNQPIMALVPVRRPVPMESDAVGTMETSGETVAVAPAGLAFGLTRVQVAVILLVFLGALKIFSWALANVVRR